MDKTWPYPEGDRGESVSCKAAWASDQESQHDGDVQSISAAEKGNLIHVYSGGQGSLCRRGDI